MERERQSIEPVETRQIKKEESNSLTTLETKLEVKNELVLPQVESAAKSGCGRCG